VFSVHPATLPEVKQIINSSKLGPLKKLAQKALEASSGAEVAKIMDIVNH